MKFIPSFGAWVAALAILAGGCADSPPERPGKGGPPPGPPPFLGGPIGAVLLTNADGFVARVAMEMHMPDQPADVLSGELMGRGSKLLFTPEASGSRGKQLRKAGISFVWDVVEVRGYMLSEALQGYAPISSRASFTIAGAGPAPNQSGGDKLQGHPCVAQEVAVTANDGSTTSLRVWRAADLNGLPLQIAMQPDLARPVLRLSKIRPATPPPEVFLAPEGFTKYRSAEMMMNELMLRQQSLKRRPSPPEGRPEGEHGPPGGAPGGNPTRSY